MNAERIKMIYQKHLETKNAIEAEKLAEEKAHNEAVDELCEIILNLLDSDAAYDKIGRGGEFYKNTAWCQISYSINDLGCIIKGTTRLALPEDSHAFPLDYEYTDKKFKRIWGDVLAKFSLEGLFVSNDRIVMTLKED